MRGGAVCRAGLALLAILAWAPLTARAAGPTALPATSFGASFVHLTTAGNSAGAATFLDHPALNDNPGAMVFVTVNAGGDGLQHSSPIAVRYDSAAARWAIVNQDGAAMPAGVRFNVLAAGSDSGSFLHVATLANSNLAWTYLDHPQTNDNPNALILATPRDAGVANRHNIATWYSEYSHKWAIVNQDLAVMPAGAAFNVLVVNGSAGALMHRANLANILGSATFFRQRRATGNPLALVFITACYNPGGGQGTYNDHPIGVDYVLTLGTYFWSVANQDNAPINSGAAFSVLVLGARADMPLMLRRR
jgi:hypothetical protein